MTGKPLSLCVQLDKLLRHILRRALYLDFRLLPLGTAHLGELDRLPCTRIPRHSVKAVGRNVKLCTVAVSQSNKVPLYSVGRGNRRKSLVPSDTVGIVYHVVACRKVVVGQYLLTAAVL